MTREIVLESLDKVKYLASLSF